MDELRRGESRPACLRRLLRDAVGGHRATVEPSATEALELLAAQARDGRTAAVIAYAKVMCTPDAADIAIHTGLVGGADFLVTGDTKLIGSTQRHPDTGAVLHVISFDDIVERISTSSFDFAWIHPQLW